MFSDTRVVNKYKEDYDILIERGTIWGNPYIHGTRNENIDKFKVYFLEEIRMGRITIKDLRSLEGKRLGCVCKPKRCHGDFIVECVNFLCSRLYTNKVKEDYFGVQID